MFDASSELQRHGRDAALLNPQVYINGTHKTNPDVRYMMDNAPYLYGDTFNNATFQYILESEESISNVLSTVLGAFGGVIGVLVLVGALIFKPMLDKMISVRKQSLDVVFSIPKDICTNIYARMQASAVHSETMEGDDEDDDENDEDNNINSSGGASMKVMYSKLTFAYVFGLVLIATFFGITVGINYVLAADLKEWGRRIDLTLQIPFIANRISYGFRELITLDEFVYLDEDQFAYNKKIQGPKKAYKSTYT